MASQIIAKKSVTVLARHRSRLVTYLPSLRTIVKHCRAFSSYDEQTPGLGFVQVEITSTGSSRPWPDAKLGPLNPKDKNCPLPGNVGIPSEYKGKSPTITKPNEHIITCELLTTPTQHERQVSVLHEFNMAQGELEKQESLYEPKPSPLDRLECVVQECPQSLKRDFQDLFPERDIRNSELTVITISQKTENDMTGWSESVEEEREQLLEHFIIGAKEICSLLNRSGYWADFIDPSSGRPYHGAFTNATFFETDERYRNFGFEIEDLGCCKVIAHHLWGTKSYVGCLFTDAPADDPKLQLFLHFDGYDSELDD